MDGDDNSDTIVYGQLVVLGFNGQLPFDSGVSRLFSKYSLEQKPEGDAQKPVTQHSHTTVSESVPYQSPNIHSVCYMVGDGENMVVTYEKDSQRDMFQIGRSSDKNDFVVMDVVPNAQKASDCMLQKSTISRFACRIYVDRAPPYNASIFAAGFDKSSNVRLGEKGMKWTRNDGMMDGLTTNGVLIMHSNSSDHGVLTNGPGIWREVSIAGDLYCLRKTRSDRGIGKQVIGESNVLKDGTLVDLCGAILVWRSRAGLAKMPSVNDIEEMRLKLNATKPQCPVGLMTLEFPQNPRRASGSQKAKTPHVYLVCGHVHGYHIWNSPMHDGEARMCPMCRQVGPYIRLKLGLEAALWADKCKPNYYAFVPCGHVCSEATVHFWAQVPLPHGCHAFRAACPFCSVPLAGEVGYVKLIFATA